jgi:hypothetical protein
VYLTDVIDKNNEEVTCSRHDIAGKNAHFASDLLTHALTQFSRCQHTFKTNLNSVLIPICTKDGMLYPKSCFTAKILHAYEYEYHNHSQIY